MTIDGHFLVEYEVNADLLDYSKGTRLWGYRLPNFSPTLPDKVRCYRDQGAASRAVDFEARHLDMVANPNPAPTPRGWTVNHTGSLILARGLPFGKELRAYRTVHGQWRHTLMKEEDPNLRTAEEACAAAEKTARETLQNWLEPGGADELPEEDIDLRPDFRTMPSADRPDPDWKYLEKLEKIRQRAPKPSSFNDLIELLIERERANQEVH